MTANEIDQLTREITAAVYAKHSVILSAISVYSLNTRNKEVVRIHDEVRKIVLSHKHVKQMHGFYLNLKDKVMRFDAVVSFDADDRNRVFEEAVASVKEAFPDYDVSTNMDMDLNEVEVK